MEEEHITTPAEESSTQGASVQEAAAQLAAAQQVAAQETAFQETAGFEPAVEEEEVLEKPARSKKWYILGGIAVVFLALAVFLGARLLKPPSGPEAAGGKGGQMMFSSKGGPGGAKSVRLNMTPAKELPQEKSTTAGLFVRREDQSIFLGTGNVRMTISKSGSGSAPSGDVQSNYDGPVVEVVVNHQTKIYKDTTEMPAPDTAKNGEITVQQVVKPGSLDDMGKNMMISVWGDKQGDRFIARVIVYR